MSVMIQLEVSTQHLINNVVSKTRLKYLRNGYFLLIIKEIDKRNRHPILKGGIRIKIKTFFCINFYFIL